MAALPKIDTQLCVSMHDFCQANPESTTLDVNVSRRWAPYLGTCFSSLNSGETSLAVDTSPWTIAYTSQVFLVDVLWTRLESWLPGSRPGLSVWKSDLLSWLGQG